MALAKIVPSISSCNHDVYTIQTSEEPIPAGIANNSMLTALWIFIEV